MVVMSFGTVVGREGSRHQGEVSALHVGALRPQRLVYGEITLGGAIGVLGQGRHHQSKLTPVSTSHSLERVREGMIRTLPSVGEGDYERLWRIDDITLHTLCHAAQRVLHQGTTHTNAFPLLFRKEDRVAGDRPIDALGRGPPGEKLTGANGRELRIPMRSLWPLDGLTVATSDEKQALPNRGSAIIAGLQLTPINIVSKALKFPDKIPEGPARPLLARFPLPVHADQRAPILELLYILEVDALRTHGRSPALPDPSQAAHPLRDGLAPLCLREVLAIGAHPEIADGTAAADFLGNHVKDGFTKVLSVRVISLMKSNRLRIMVDSDVGGAAECPFHPGAGPAPAGEKIHDQLSREIKRRLRMNSIRTAVTFSCHLPPFTNQSSSKTTDFRTVRCVCPMPSSLFKVPRPIPL